MADIKPVGVNLTTGQSNATSSGDTLRPALGDLTISGGNNGTVSGNLTLTTGTVGTGGSSGSITIQPGPTSGTSTGGSVSISAGGGNNGGSIVITASPTSLGDGYLSLSGGNSVYISTPTVSFGSAEIRITTGNADDPGSSAGPVVIDTGEASHFDATPGTVFLGTTNAAEVIIGKSNGEIGFYSANPVLQPAVTGDSTSETLQSLVSAMNSLGLVLNLSTAEADRISSRQGSIGADDDTNGLILVQPGGTIIGTLTGPPITLGPVYYDPANGMTIRFGNSIFIDGDGVVNTISGRDATMPTNEVYYDVPAPPAATANLATVGSGFLAQFPVVAGTVVVQVILENGVVFSTVTDDGAGSFPVSAVLPAGGTINYTTGAITGTTDLLEPYSQIVFFYVVANQSGEDLSPRGGNGVGTGAGGDLNLSGGDGGPTSGHAGSIFLTGGTPTNGNGGSISLTGSSGVGADRPGGSLILTNGSSTGTATPTSIQLTGRVCGNKASDASSANNLTLGNGNYIDITGNTQINAIATAGWTAGSVVILQFDSDPLVKNNTAGDAGFASMLLAGGVDFNATAGDTLTLCYDGITWRETSRSVI